MSWSLDMVNYAFLRRRIGHVGANGSVSLVGLLAHFRGDALTVCRQPCYVQRELGDPGEQSGRKAWATALRYSTVGLEFGVGAALGYVIGRWLDRKFDTDPYLTLVMLLLGIAAAFASLLRVVKEVQASEDDNGDDQAR